PPLGARRSVRARLPHGRRGPRAQPPPPLAPPVALHLRDPSPRSPSGDLPHVALRHERPGPAPSDRGTGRDLAPHRDVAQLPDQAGPLLLLHGHRLGLHLAPRLVLDAPPPPPGGSCPRPVGRLRPVP